MKVIFLDIDGVLNTYRTQTQIENRYVPYFSDLEPELMNNLVTLLDVNPGYRIIIHSSWREDLKTSDLQSIFTKLGYQKIADAIFGVTNPNQSKPDSILEIVQMLRLRNFVILDDDQLFDLGDELHKKQFKTSLFTGLREKDLPKINRILNEIM